MGYIVFCHLYLHRHNTDIVSIAPFCYCILQNVNDESLYSVKPISKAIDPSPTTGFVVQLGIWLPVYPLPGLSSYDLLRGELPVNSENKRPLP